MMHFSSQFLSFSFSTSFFFALSKVALEGTSIRRHPEKEVPKRNKALPEKAFNAMKETRLATSVHRGQLKAAL